jgi:ATP-dependent DNA helicase RecG
MSEPDELQLPRTESLTVEFKSDRDCLSDEELVETIVCLANGEGGSLYLGVEDDGSVTGLHAKHRNVSGLATFIANKTQPRFIVEARELTVAGLPIALIRVPKAQHIVATSSGTIKRRRLDSHGRPECVAMMPHEFSSRLSDLRSLDVSRQPVAGATLVDLDPAERARLRQFVERFHGDRSLIALSDDELDGALGIVVREGGERVPSLAGLLLIGREPSLRELVPTHEVAFQVLDGEAVRVNEFSKAPLLRIFEWLDTLFTSINVEEELQVGLFRVPVPLVDRGAFREAIANALTHRDYARLGTVHVRFDGEALSISNPGGFVEGVTTDNLLTTEPHPRNPTLADAFKRVGLVERTGRGVDLIYRGLLRYGRATPDYARSSATSVVLRLSASAADFDFLKLMLEAEQRYGGPLPIDGLIALTALREQRRLTSDELARRIQKDRATAKHTLEELSEAGLVEAHGNTKGRSYTLAAKVYGALGQQAEYTRQAGFERAQQEHMVLNHATKFGRIRRPDVVKLCRLSEDQATRLLKRLTDEGRLRAEGDKRGRTYVLPASRESR